jgi:formylglycine-generating enzyme required for sulfatase activity
VTALERPRHTLSRNNNIIVEKYEVTQQQWQAVLPTSPWYFTGCGSNCPVESVSLYDIVYYLNQRSLEDGLTPCYTLTGCSGSPGAGCAEDGFPAPTFCDGDYVCDSVRTVLRCDGHRLPTNAEWETAAGTNGSDYPGGVNNLTGTSVCANVAALSTYAQYCANSDVTYSPCTNLAGSSGPACAGPAPVGSYSPLPSGLFDALGNVYEWVWDNDDAYPFGLTSEPVVRTLLNTDFGIRRGGGWWSFVSNARLTQRERTLLTTRSNLNGFRIARTLFVPTCYNGVRDAGETDIDCGSPDCSECP